MRAKTREFKKAILKSAKQDTVFNNAERSTNLLKSLNEVSKAIRPQFVGFLLLLAYVTVTAVAITDIDLLMSEGAKLPLIDTQVPLSLFFVFSPFIVLIYHYHILLQLSIMARTAERFVRQVNRLGAKRFDERFATDSFMLSYSIAGPERGLFNSMLSIPLIASLLLLPPIIIILFQVKFLPYQDEIVTWWHRFVVAIDLALIGYFMPRIFNFRASRRWKTSSSNRVQRHKTHARKIRIAILALTVPIFLFSWIIALIPMEPWERHLSFALHGEYPSNDEVIDLPLTRWLFFPLGAEHHRTSADNCLDAKEKRYFHRNLDVCRRLIVRGFSKPELHADLLNFEVNALKAVEGKTLVNRNFRYANFAYARLPLANLSENDFHGANFNGADLRFTTFDGSNLVRAKLRGANLSGANIMGNEKGSASLDFADFSGAILTCARLEGTSAKNAIFDNAMAAGASFTLRDLSGANFRNANLLTADLVATTIDKKTNFSKAIIYLAEIQPLNGMLSQNILNSVKARPASGKMKAYDEGNEQTLRHTFEFTGSGSNLIKNCKKKFSENSIKLYPEN